jgi:hypothetical protein
VIVQDQTEQIECLLDPATFGSGAGVERIDTHSAVVVLVGEAAYKLKRAVRYDYLDFSTPELRRWACEAEVALNRRTAPGVYLGVVAVTREADGRLAVGGAGTPVDWLVHMRRFDNAGLLDRLAADGRLDESLMAPLALAIAGLHAMADRRDDQGGLAGMTWVIDGNASGFADEARGVLDRDACERVIAATRRALARHAAVLERRRREGRVRVCHGDLHLGNIVVIDGRPVLFDAIEFNDRISCIDVLYDLAFLLMDLWRLGLRRHANELFNTYLTAAGEWEGLSLLPLFLSCRSAVRAKTTATASVLQVDAPHAAALAAAAREYLAAAAAFLEPAPAGLVAIGGWSGTGKSTQARRIAGSIGAAPGALVLRSDVVRKAIFGVSQTTRLPDEAYTPEVSRRVYEMLADRAAATLAGGHSAIVDAVFEHADARRRFAELATARGVPFAGIWLDAPAPLLLERVDGRRDDASDATASVVMGQSRRDPGPIEWTHVDATGTVEQVERAVRAALGPLAAAV